MEYRQLGASGLRVPVLSFGTATFGGGNQFFKAWGNTQVDEAKKLVNLCLDAGVNFFDTANVYSRGLSEEILGKALEGLRNRVLISTKATFTMGDGPNDYGSSREHLIQSCNDSLRRLSTDHIDVYHMHGFDATTPVEETLRALDDLITSGKVRYIACSNFSGWHLMKSLSVSERYGWARYIAHQAYYSLLNREFEWELMPVGIDQNVSTIVWSPLSSGQLSGKFRRGQPVPESSRISQGGEHGPATNFDRLHNIVDVLEEVAKETGKTVAQVALNWLLQRPTVANLVIGARDEEQLKQNLAAVGWNLDIEQIKRLDAASEVDPIYPYWHQRQNLKLVPLPKFY
ncbi:aldo/keto reductase [Mucilaginibacter sp. X4EP1]|uniref:aldo/keto reductase n=1 Tax=Mucilaginibacter sp. X4EP1 TaxID=2723092 RepID=UPI00216712B4|nr:aldo/keto reductase [Mucilaginibacter sp. X4EP1]MCS3812203.1 aryl-alcohol dehydrogenase-like predicted oxidoreductase [Mucilaginibacter sp. X4EP1]